MKSKNKWILILTILVGLGSYIYIDSVEKEKIKEEKKRQEEEKEEKREKQKQPLTQTFVDTFSENIEYGMTQEEIKEKLGEPMKISGQEETERYIYEENEYGSYLDQNKNYDWTSIKNKKGYRYIDKEPNSNFLYKIDSEDASLVYFYFTDGKLSRLNFV